MIAAGEIITNLIIVGVVVGLNVGVAILLYRDSKRRNNNATLWACLTLLFGFLTGIGGLLVGLVYATFRFPSFGNL